MDVVIFSYGTLYYTLISEKGRSGTAEMLLVIREMVQRKALGRQFN